MSTPDGSSSASSSSLLLLLLPLLLSVLAPSHVCRAADVPEDATSEFSVRLYQRLQAAGDQDNIIFSPLSLAVALSMVELGARGKSLQEIREAVGFTHLLPGEGHDCGGKEIKPNQTQSTKKRRVLLNLCNSKIIFYILL